MSPVMKQLVLKDWQLHRALVFFTMACGVASLSLLLLKRETTVVVGSVFFFITLIFVGTLFAGSNIVNERKKQTLPFMMSLPVSAVQYAVAKLVSTVGIFLIPWLALAIAAVWFVAGAGILPHGTIPMAVILLLFPFVCFCLITGVALVGETEPWYIAANVVCNSSYGLTWYFISRTPALTRDFLSKTAVWSPAVLTFLGAELAAVVVILGVTFYLQSRKRDFI
jgi:ABC-2 type transport system permease protein